MCNSRAVDQTPMPRALAFHTSELFSIGKWVDVPQLHRPRLCRRTLIHQSAIGPPLSRLYTPEPLDPIRRTFFPVSEARTRPSIALERSFRALHSPKRP